MSGPRNDEINDSTKSQINSQFYRVLAWNVINTRQGHRLTQDELAQKTGLSRMQISRIECGHGEISFEALVKLADFFDIKVAKLCEDVPRGRKVQWRIRTGVQEKEDLKFHKIFSEAPKIHWMTLSPRKFRAIKFQKNSIYDFVVLSGHVIFEFEDTLEMMKAQEVLSLKGEGSLRMRSVSGMPKSEILVIQSFVRDGI